MSEKRFVLDYEDDDTIFIDDNKLKKHLTIRNVKIKMGDLNDIVDRLNQLDGENEELLKKEKHLHKVITRKDKRINNLVRNKEQLKKENEQLRDELTFLNKVISFFADNPMTKYSSKNELLEEMKLLEKMGLI